MIFSLKRQVAVRPFPSHTIERENKGGFVIAANKAQLTRLEVVFDTDPADGTVLKAGGYAYLPKDASSHQWSKIVYEHPTAGPYVLAMRDLVYLYEQPA